MKDKLALSFIYLMLVALISAGCGKKSQIDGVLDKIESLTSKYESMAEKGEGINQTTMDEITRESDAFGKNFDAAKSKEEITPAQQIRFKELTGRLGVAMGKIMQSEMKKKGVNLNR